MLSDPLNWSSIAHTVGDMRGEQPYDPAEVLLPDGSVGVVIEMVLLDSGRWRATVRRAVEEPDAEEGDIEVTEIDMLESAVDSDQPRAPFTATIDSMLPAADVSGAGAVSASPDTSAAGTVGSAAPSATDDFLEDIESTPRPPSREDIDRLIDRFRELPGNLAGGSLHIVLDDGNWERECIEECRDVYAVENKDEAGRLFADLLLTLTDEQLRDFLGSSYCGRCCQDIEPDLDGEGGCRCPEGPRA